VALFGNDVVEIILAVLIKHEVIWGVRNGNEKVFCIIVALHYKPTLRCQSYGIFGSDICCSYGIMKL